MSGYHPCPCRECFEIAIGEDEDTGEPSLCWECEDAGCDADGESACCVERDYEDEEEVTP